MRGIVQLLISIPNRLPKIMNRYVIPENDVSVTALRIKIINN